ncbi:unnamed protein product [Vitrella brassicaformis CCMP3155]|uniref:Uncharacterized protein n=1 Tax=Vitrella brassicaformis (strain CCMP3155) TaxID=1169540 RepID=A0A0G4EI58_VITBC|nr:unnamed protein product [Vitrella brassicaformis CCMP3155]|eukprot:CEL95683.1 unnamed protein product [Vitrella brassicaformis CCMP3155]
MSTSSTARAAASRKNPYVWMAAFIGAGFAWAGGIGYFVYTEYFNTEKKERKQQEQRAKEEKEKELRQRRMQRREEMIDAYRQQRQQQSLQSPASPDADADAPSPHEQGGSFEDRLQKELDTTSYDLWRKDGLDVPPSEKTAAANTQDNG